MSLIHGEGGAERDTGRLIGAEPARASLRSAVEEKLDWRLKLVLSSPALLSRERLVVEAGGQRIWASLLLVAVGGAGNSCSRTTNKNNTGFITHLDSSS